MQPNQPSFLDRKEILKIKLCCILPTLVGPAFLSSLLLPGEWILLTMINEVGFDGEGTDCLATLPLLLAFVAINMILFSVAALYPLFAVRGNGWKEICEKINMHQHELNSSETATAGEMSFIMNRNPYSVANACSITIPSTKKQKWAIFLVPIMILLAVSVPTILQSREAKQQKNEQAAQMMQQLESAFTQDGVRCLRDSIGAPMQDTYDFMVCNDDDPQERYFSVYFDTEGGIYNLVFHMYPDEMKTAQENLNDFLEYVQKNIPPLKKSGVNVNIPDWERHTQPLPELTSEYLKSEGKMDYQESVEDGDVKILFSNRCKDATPDNPAYLYFMIRNSTVD